MEKIIEHTGLVAVLNRSDVDTDQIIPKQFLKKIERTGFGIHLFHDWRFLDDAGTQPDPKFELNQARYQGASVLIAGENFGCGSSREHAPWALSDYGFKVIIAPSFADIFFNNCYKNGMIPAILPSSTVKQMMALVEKTPGIKLSVDLKTKKIKIADLELDLVIDDFKRECLMNGWDDIGLSMQKIKKIDEFESRHFKEQPWIKVS